MKRRQKKTRRRKKQKIEENDTNAKLQEERELESLLFGQTQPLDVLQDEILQQQQDEAEEKEALELDEDQESDMPLFFDDRVGEAEESNPTNIGWADNGSEEKDTEATTTEAQTKGTGSVWRDEDDEKIMVNIAGQKRTRKLRENENESVLSGVEYTKRLQQKHTELNCNTAWAQEAVVESESDSDSEEDEEFRAARRALKDTDVTSMLRSTASLNQRSFSSGHVDIVRLPDANLQSPSNSVVKTVEFHPNSQLLMTAGLDKKIRLFQIEGRQNPLVQSVIFPDMPIMKAHFSADGKQVIACGRRKYFYTYDLTSGQGTKISGIRGRSEKGYDNFAVSPDGKSIIFQGNNGYLVVVDARSKQWVGQFKMNGTVRASSFSPDGKHLYSFGSEGQVYNWDVRQRRCIGRVIDDGCVNGTAIAASDNYLVTGQDAGVVNVYHHQEGQGADHDWFKSKPNTERYKPTKTLMNLTTPIDHINIDPSGELMVIASQRKKDALRLVHLPSQTVATNWPTSNTPLHYITSTAFSPKSGYLAIGNDRGRVLLYRIPYFQAA